MTAEINKNCILYYKSALELGLPCKINKDFCGFTINLANKTYIFRSTDTPFNNAGSINVARNKYCANKILAAAGIPVPKTIGISKREFILDDYPLDDLKFPLVAKPTLDSALGKDVLCNIKDKKTLFSYLDKNLKKYPYISIEEFHNYPKAYRVLVFRNKVIGVIERTPAHVIGDGIHTIAELISITNNTRKKLKNKVSLGMIKLDKESYIILEELGLSCNYIPRKDEHIKLCYSCNSSRGGTITSLGKKICRENAALAIKAAKALDLDLVGFDVICDDINVAITKSHGIFVEANYNPDVTIHEKPMIGKSTRVSKIIIRKLMARHPFAYLRCRLKKINFIKWTWVRVSIIILLFIVLHHFIYNSKNI